MQATKSSASDPVRSIAIVGGGTAGWSAAALLGRVLGASTRITLVESGDIPTVGVGEATIPPIFEFLRRIGFDETDFIRTTQASFKLAIRFQDWLRPGHDYWHPFGSFGVSIENRPFQNYWWKAEDAGVATSTVAYCTATALADAGKFSFPPPDGRFPGGGLSFALHFDAGLVAQQLRRHSEGLGITRMDSRVERVEWQGERIARLHLAGGESLEADLFIDCSGFRALLASGAPGAAFADWSHWLPCDRAVAMPTAISGPRTPYTISAARPAGWQWRIPLQHRVGNGHVYSSAHVSDDEAAAILKRTVDGEPLAEPRLLSFTAGHRPRPWIGNCVAIGLAAGFLEPLESTSIHLIHTGLGRLLDYFPDRHFSPELADAFNRETADEYAHIRDFLLLHYVPNQRHGEPFWDMMRNLDLPESLTEKLALFRSSGRLLSRRRELFADVNWFHVAQGMGLRPERGDPLVDLPDFAAVTDVMQQVEGAIAAYVQAAPTHDAILERLLDPAETRRPNYAVGADWAGR